LNATPAVDDLLITAEGYQQLCSELETLRSHARRDMSKRLREARADGHLDDNPALFDLLEEQARLERRIAVLEGRLAAARIAEPNADGSAGIGSSVRLRELESGELVEFELVGTIEGNSGRGRISVDAPVGRALVGAAAGDVVSVDCPRGTLGFKVVRVCAAARPTPARKEA
jgi:transcription elongation factor GreA